MKVVKANEMVRLEHEAYARGAQEEIFMENAGRQIAQAIEDYVNNYSLQPNITLLCGKGNNGGDAYVAGRLLLKKGCKVEALALEPSSPLCQKKSGEFGGKIVFVKSSEDISFDDAALLVDGIFGTGFKGEVHGLPAEVIKKANLSKLPIIAIDTPSGINGETGEISSTAIFATKTLFLGLPKAGCFLGEAWNHVGEISIHDFGLAMDDAKEDFQLLEEEEIRGLLPSFQRTCHKYQRGYVVGLGGSPGMPGAPILSGFSALKSGAGIVRILHPSGMEAEFAGAPYELIHEGYSNAKMVLERMSKASSLFIGPGIGVLPEVRKILKQVLAKLEKPCVIDAEALTLIAEEDYPIPKNVILTPHEGEMRRLLHRDDKPKRTQLIELAQKFSDENEVTVVLKGAPTFIFHPGKKPFISPRGDPGMATAGSGDVLTGVIAAFLAQGLTPLNAACVGVYLHGMAGECAAKKYSSHTMTASNIIDCLPKVYNEL